MRHLWALQPANPMVLYYPRDLSGKIYIDPSYDEPCSVVVNMNPSPSSRVNVQVLPPGTASDAPCLQTPFVTKLS